MLKVSVITAVYNNKSMIASAIDSVLGQNYSNVEYIIVDGASDDGTVEIIKKYGDKISIFISETDTGIYQALNKGIEHSTGDVICFLHADDFYNDNTVIDRVVKQFEVSQADSVFGDLVYVNKLDTSKIIRYWKSGNFSLKKMNRGWMPPHPAFFVKKEVYSRIGSFDESFKIAADYDFILRALKIEQISASYLPEVVYRMRVGGISNRSLKSLFLKSKEDYRVLRKNGLKNKTILLFKNLSKVKQFFSK